MSVNIATRASVAAPTDPGRFDDGRAPAQNPAMSRQSTPQYRYVSVILLSVALAAALVLALTSRAHAQDHVKSLRAELATSSGQVRLDHTQEQKLSEDVTTMQIDLTATRSKLSSIKYRAGQCVRTVLRDTAPFTFTPPLESTPCEQALLKADLASASNRVSAIQTTILAAEVTPPVTAVCADYSFSYSQNASGTCSWHGGVGAWVNYP
jgi:hypothetical protein